MLLRQIKLIINIKDFNRKLDYTVLFSAPVDVIFGLTPLHKKLRCIKHLYYIIRVRPTGIRSPPPLV